VVIIVINVLVVGWWPLSSLTGAEAGGHVWGMSSSLLQVLQVVIVSGALTGVTHQTCLVLWTWRKLADETNAKNTHPRSVERLPRLEGYRQPSLSISHKVMTILMRRMNTSSL